MIATIVEQTLQTDSTCINKREKSEAKVKEPTVLQLTSDFWEAKT